MNTVCSTVATIDAPPGSPVAAQRRGGIKNHSPTTTISWWSLEWQGCRQAAGAFGDQRIAHNSPLDVRRRVDHMPILGFGPPDESVEDFPTLLPP